MKLINLIFLLSFLFLFASCADLMTPRSFVDEMDRESDGFWVAGKDFPVVGGDTGSAYRSREEIRERTPKSEKERTRSLNREIVRKQLEDREDYLSEAERARYLKDSEFLSTTSERLYYLSLSPLDRTEYIKTKRPLKGDSTSAYYSDSSSSRASGTLRVPASLAGDVSIGMSKDEVTRLWGKPMRVDIAGDPRNQNERWVYYEDGRLKQLYFESGHIEGWTLE